MKATMISSYNVFTEQLLPTNALQTMCNGMSLLILPSFDVLSCSEQTDMSRASAVGCCRRQSSKEASLRLNATILVVCVYDLVNPSVFQCRVFAHMNHVTTIAYNYIAHRLVCGRLDSCGNHVIVPKESHDSGVPRSHLVASILTHY